MVTNTDDENSSDESDAELTEKRDDLDPVEMDESSDTSPLRFQERSMRQYFREMEVDERGLRSSPSSAHLTIFEMALCILSVSVEDEFANGLPINRKLREYAANFWLQHFLEVSSDKATERDVKRVMDALHSLLNPHGASLKNIEEYFQSDGELFWGSQERRQRFFDSLKKWAECAKSLPSGSLSNEELSWIQDLLTSAETILLQLAKCHVRNWFKAYRYWCAQRSLQFALSALRMVWNNESLRL